MMDSTPTPVLQAISSFGYANRHPEDADRIAKTYCDLLEAIQLHHLTVPDQINQARRAGRKAAHNWFCAHGQSLATHRDLSRAEWAGSLTPSQAQADCADLLAAYTTGYSEGVADLIGGRHG